MQRKKKDHMKNQWQFETIHNSWPQDVDAHTTWNVSDCHFFRATWHKTYNLLNCFDEHFHQVIALITEFNDITVTSRYQTVVPCYIESYIYISLLWCTLIPFTTDCWGIRNSLYKELLISFLLFLLLSFPSFSNFKIQVEEPELTFLSLRFHFLQGLSPLSISLLMEYVGNSVFLSCWLISNM